MRHVTDKSNRMQKHKFGAMCPGTLFMETSPVPLMHEKYFIKISHPRHTEIHYVNRRSHRVQKHNFGAMCPDALFIECIPVPAEHEK
jgi:hypothetical protein